MTQDVSRAVVPRGAADLRVIPPAASFADDERLAKTFYKSGLFKDVRDEAQAIVKVIYGRELGLPPMASMLGIHIVDGRPTLAAATVATLIKRSGRYTFRVREHSAQTCVLDFYERVGDDWLAVGESAFSMADAAAAGVGGKAVWKQYPRNMLWSRAVTNGARWYCADVFGAAVYTAEELGGPVPDDDLSVRMTVDAAPVRRAAPAAPAPDPWDDDDDDDDDAVTPPPHPLVERATADGEGDLTLDGKALWAYGGLVGIAITTTNGTALESIVRCPIHDRPFYLLANANAWAHGRPPQRCVYVSPVPETEPMDEDDDEEVPNG